MQRNDQSIIGVSYIGKPRSNTAMFLSAKANKLLRHLDKVEGCLIFAEFGLDVPDDLLKRHIFEFSENPQLAYYHFTKQIEKSLIEKNKIRKYRVLDNGARIGENVTVGKNVEIEPLVFIDHDCQIGHHVHLGAGSIIRRAKIRDHVQIAEQVLIGADGYNLVEENQHLYSMPTLGKVEIGHGAVIGSKTIISAGLAGLTEISEYAQIDSGCHIHHDCQIGKNVELCSHVIMGGFTVIKNHAFIGIGTQIKNRITIGESAMIGMGSVVVHNIPDKGRAYGVPARLIE